MRVSAFCRKYRISTQAVYKKIKNYEKQLNGHIAEIALLMQERDNLKSELSPIRTELSELQLSLEQEKAKFLSAEKMWNEEKYTLTAEISELNLALQSANKQISDFTARSEERNAKNNGFMGLFGRY